MNRVVAAISKLLEPAERECVCGDLKELGLSAPAAAASILGLVTRRQLAEWSYWRPWVALFGVAGIAGWYLSRSVAEVQMGLWLQIRTYVTYGVAYEPGGVSAMQEIAYTGSSAIAMLLWAWACGFVLARLSGRALWITSFLFYCAVRDTWTVRMALSGNIILKHSLWATLLFRLLPLEPLMLEPALIVFLLALTLGVHSGRKGTLKRDTRLLLTAAGFALILLLAWMESWFAAGFAHWSGQAYVATPFLLRVLPLLAGAWPVFLISLPDGLLQGPDPHCLTGNGRLTR